MVNQTQDNKNTISISISNSIFSVEFTEDINSHTLFSQNPLKLNLVIQNISKIKSALNSDSKFKEIGI